MFLRLQKDPALRELKLAGSWTNSARDACYCSLTKQAKMVRESHSSPTNSTATAAPNIVVKKRVEAGLALAVPQAYIALACRSCCGAQRPEGRKVRKPTQSPGED